MIYKIDLNVITLTLLSLCVLSALECCYLTCNHPQWDPLTLENVEDEQVNLVFEPFEEDSELKVSENEQDRYELVQFSFPYCIYD